MALIEKKTYVKNEIDYDKLAKTVSENCRTEIDYDKLAACIATALQKNENSQTESAVHILLQIFSCILLVILGLLAGDFCIKTSYITGSSFFPLKDTIMMYAFALSEAILSVLFFAAAYNIYKTKKLELLNVAFTAIISVSSLVVAILSYQSVN